MNGDSFPICLCYSSWKINQLSLFVANLCAAVVIILIYGSLCLGLTFCFQGNSCTSDVTETGGTDRQTHLQTVWLCLWCQHRYAILLLYFWMCIYVSGLWEQRATVKAGLAAALITLWPICCSTCFDLIFNTDIVLIFILLFRTQVRP